MADAEPLLTPFTWRRPRQNTPGLILWVDDRFAAESPMPDDCRGEFGIDRAERRETRWLVVTEDRSLGDRSGDRSLWEEYEPLSKHPELFRTFIDTETSEAGFLSFAQRYGTLGVQSTLQMTHRLEGLSEFGEALYLWRKEQALLRAADRVATALVRRQSGALEGWIVPAKNGYKLSDGFIDPVFLPTGSGVMGRLELAGLRKPALWVAHDALSSHSQKIRLAARYWLARQVNQRLEGLSGHTSAVAVRVLPLEDEGLPIHLSPNSLLAALWIQLVESINGNRKFKRCKACRGWFLASPESVGLKAHAKYCSSKCRLRAWRRSGAKSKGKGR